MQNNEIPDGTMMTVTAEIVTLDENSFMIKLYNDETNEVASVGSVDEYADYIIVAVNKSGMDNFSAKWLPSPNASRKHIDLIGMQLGNIQQRFDEEIEPQMQPE